VKTIYRQQHYKENNKTCIFCYRCHVTAMRVVIAMPIFPKVSVWIKYSKVAEVFKTFWTDNKPRI
jgi:hypothetical protein